MGVSGVGWSTDDALAQILEHRVWEFEFPQVVSLLQRMQRGAAWVGRDGPFSKEGIRFVPYAALASSASEVRELTRVPGPSADEQIWQLTVSVFGMYGANAPGPAYLLEEAAGGGEATRAASLRSFLDLFGNRLTGFYFETWRKYRWPVVFRRGGTDAISRCVFCLLGLGTGWGAPSARRTLSEHSTLEPIRPQTRLLRYVGLFSQRVRSPENLRRLLWDYFDGPDIRCHEFVEVDEFVPRWLEIEQRRRCSVGRSHTQLGCSPTEDRQVIVGQRMRDCGGTFRVVLGPLSQADFRTFLPNGERLAVLLALTNLYRPRHMDYDIRLRLRAEEVPSLRIGKRSPERLGWSTWLQTPALRRPREGVVTFRSLAGSGEARTVLRKSA